MSGAPSAGAVGSAAAAGTGPRRRAALRTTLVALLLATVAVVCLAVGLVTHVSVGRQLDAELDAQLQRASERAGARELGNLPLDPADRGAGIPDGEGGGPGSGEYELTAHVQDGTITAALWRDDAGELRALTVADREELEAALDELADGAGAGTGPGGIGTAGAPGEAVSVTLSIGTYRVMLQPLDDSAAVVTGLPLAENRSTLLRLDLTLLGAGLGALVVTGLGGSLLVRRTLSPLEGVAELASEVARTPLEHGSVRLEQRVPGRHAVPGTEVGDVGAALNLLLDNVEGAIETRHRSEERMRRFIADASHELRTPLTAIRGYTEMLRLTEELSDRGLQSVDRLQAQSGRMTSLVEDLLLLTRLDDRAPLLRVPVDLGEIVLECAMDARAAGPDHPLDVSVPDEPVMVAGEEAQLAQVVVNLLSNARKHTPEGTAIAVRLRAEPGGARLEVADAGPGIDPELLPDVFSRFTRADRARSGGEGTSGLGLSIVRAIVEAHEGTIAVASEPGRTVFTVSLPLARE
ncbi:ATP-binding protein [Brachybacterium sp. J144]|uniref:sensor histidine kinase n=1 Tax=Brachybacterium sp. J144 TaxID=3116487 RepID=UPI002E7A3375|nr:ATP-binding protein [Brachybacterium sp. J144]MEE1651771.1 ATP-binding protein [Brachybacterium sp. J144]